MKSIIYIGMDVHKESYSLCALDDASGEILGRTRCAADVTLVEKFVTNVKKKSGGERAIQAGYEAGCLGYALRAQLVEKGIACDILAPTTMYSSAKNKRVKNDKMDAKMIALNLANGTYKSVYIPKKEDVEIKEYVRMLADFRAALTTVKQQIKALILRHGYRYEGKSSWTMAYMKWLRSLDLGDLLTETLEEYLLQYETLVDKIERFQARLETFSHQETYEQPVSQLKCFKGINTISAMTLQVEISDFTRFPNAKAFTSYLGLTPSEYSSGEKVNRNSITKQGNSTVRSTLVECAQALVKGKIGQKSKRVKQRQKGQASQVIAYADKAVERLQRKYHQMMYRGKPRNVVITAVARELACFIWGMETGNLE
ncbi:IS110 family transposase [Tetragenococcus koreensis]|uniref:Transposase n=1 Tax=Tetragenococcus koreensis TaxID=290335 RepID=A0AAN4RJI8_9ENTE|nr:IS110 family transposase [Tetragenococcus koreensis]MDN6572249.1 IS110 family transposase [Staphylococcus equorum]MDN6730460.1 IS110 family transposase [Alkalibacterium sp.]MCF1618300.1 IS110 family transposase [Tetragenococcus koreensis]MCF1619025.1 IS110 family transposase [Tetragenococcus koreensis]MCF1622816.1 IS110 family transposase [Tetragenococcus koreensis]